MNWIQSLTKAIQYIESNLTHDITVNDVANHVYASNAHYQRVFSLVTGITIGDYIRNRRLSLAGQDLLLSKNRIIDVAMKYQYDSQESFSKAFTRFHGITPHSARKQGHRLKYFRPLTINIVIQGGFDMASNREILSIAQYSSYESDPMEKLLAGAESPRVSNKIKEYKKIEPWQNYFLCSAICSVGLKLGSGIDDYKFYANFTGDNFTYLYSEEVGNPENLQCDSGVTSYFFVPQFVKKAYAAFGYDCIYISNSEIKKDFRAVMNAIKTSVDKDIPVLAWGMGNVTCSMTEANGMIRWDRYDPLSEGCLIGGYDENDVLYVNLYPGPERLPEDSVDEYGYSAITNGLDTTYGLFFAGEKLSKTDMRQNYQSVIDSIPTFLTLPPTEGNCGMYVFGKTAFATWAETLETDSFFENKTDEQLNGICWNLHSSPYCCVCTSSAYDFFKGVTEQYPDLTMAATLLPLYKKMQDYKDAIWTIQGGFYTPIDKLRTHEFRVQIADILRKMGGVCDEIVMAYGEVSETN
ncbi:helix-turn-helix transcriptional regulator [Bianquea renquensis]|uniref:Helix-turn-helix transcriptional regulator n=1 Tax=Bianquea renquensis TaxID=2763661 RepID=A0A926I3J4_9FIRM|nr:AraC family transcriptional regulator [Bianquea renquensis]MBC8545196.1 helix-turn-helix transcriptional regulator [Bianquea renquensis]